MAAILTQSHRSPCPVSEGPFLHANRRQWIRAAISMGKHYFFEASRIHSCTPEKDGIQKWRKESHKGRHGRISLSKLAGSISARQYMMVIRYKGNNIRGKAWIWSSQSSSEQSFFSGESEIAYIVQHSEMLDPKNQSCHIMRFRNFSCTAFERVCSTSDPYLQDSSLTASRSVAMIPADFMSFSTSKSVVADFSEKCAGWPRWLWSSRLQNERKLDDL